MSVGFSRHSEHGTRRKLAFQPTGQWVIGYGFTPRSRKFTASFTGSGLNGRTVRPFTEFCLGILLNIRAGQDKPFIDKKKEKCPDSFSTFGPFTMVPLIGSGGTKKPKKWIQLANIRRRAEETNAWRKWQQNISIFTRCVRKKVK